MYPDFTKEELVILRNHLVREMKYFWQSPVEWKFWNSMYKLDEMEVIFKKIEQCLQEEKSNEVI